MKAAFLLLTILPFVVAQAAASEGLGSLTGSDKRGAFSDPVLGKFLPVNQAFQANAWRDDSRLYVGFRNAEGYYLHRHQFALESRDSTVSFGELELPPGELVVHEYLGEIYVFYGSVMFSAPIETTEADMGGPLAITVTFQGCSDAGLCYPPAQIDLEVFSGSPPVDPAPAHKVDNGVPPTNPLLDDGDDASIPKAHHIRPVGLAQALRG